MEKNLFIIRYPFQLLSAQEAINYFKLKNNILIIIFNFHNPKKHKEQLKNLINYNLWDKVTIEKENYKSNFFKQLNFIKQLRKEQYNYVFIKNSFLAHDRLIISNIKYNKLILLEDGTITFRLRDKLLNDLPLFSLKKKLLRFCFFGLKLKKRFSFEIFTMFDLPKLKNINIHKHNFEYLRTIYKIETKNKSKNEIFIIGQQYVETNYISLDVYLNFIESVLKKYKEYKITYMMHRQESEEKLDILLKNYNNFKVIKSETMGELFFIQLPYKPFLVIGTTSTLLFSLKKFFPNMNILSYVFDEKDILFNHQWFKNNYKSFEKESIDFIKENDLK